MHQDSSAITPVSGDGDRQFRRFALAILSFGVLMGALLLLLPSGARARAVIDNLMQFVGPLLAAGFFFWTRPRVPARRWTPLLLTVGVLCFALGQVIWSYYELVLDRPVPIPGFSDIFFLSAYPFLLAAILLLPGSHTSSAVRTRVALDGLMIMIATVTFSWYFILGPTLLAGAGSALEKAVALAYPLGDLVLIGCLLLLLGRVGSASRARVGLVLIGALGVIVATDSNLLVKNLAGTYATGGLADIGWPIGYMLVALGACGARAMPRSLDAPQEPRSAGAGLDVRLLLQEPTRLWLALLPYAVLPLIGVLLIYALRTAAPALLSSGVYVGSALLFALVLLRQVFAILENGQLYGALQQSYTSLEINNAALAEANRRLEGLSTIDPLTDLPNHRAMVLALDAELERGQRWSQPFALLFLDLDHFKALNDGYGHNTGDAALREFGAIVRATLRAVDTFGRWGGEEFVAALPQTDRAGALAIAERVRAAIAAQPFTELRLHLTCSIGLALYPDDGVERNELVAAADHAMYGAKHLGRNQVRANNDPVLRLLKAGGASTRDATALACTVDALAELVEMRDRYTGRQTEELADLAAQIARALKLEAAEVQLIGMAGRLHDIGKVALPDALLQKPGRLTDEEWTLIRTHPIVGADVVSRVPSLRHLVPSIRHHHEHWNGGGYPDGLAGDAIPLGARIVAAVDAFAAITHERPYRQARSVDIALAELDRCAGTQFDPAVVAALHAVLHAQSEGMAGGATSAPFGFTPVAI